MCKRETEREMVRRHVEEGAKHIERQRALVARFKTNGWPFHDAETLLVTFKDIQRQHEDHLARIAHGQG